MNYLKQPWFWILIGILIFFTVVTTAYFLGKRNGRSQASTEFDVRQGELLKKAQEADARAEKYRSEAEAAEFYAGKLKDELSDDRKIAASTEIKIEEDHLLRQREIDKKYEADKNYINSDMDSCTRCRDLCDRADRLAKYGSEFAGAKCGIDSCAVACSNTAN